MKKNYNIQFSPPDMTFQETKEVIKTLKSGWITTGPKTKLFENKIANYIGLNKAVCLNSWTAAMETTLRILGIGPGDEVITSSYTYTASASIIHHVGAKIILVDIKPDTFEMDYDKVEKEINKNTKAIIPIDIAGIICDYDKLYEIVNKKKDIFKPNNARQKAIGRVAILADAAHSFGAIKNGKISGNFADFTCFSFHAVKNLTTSEGGAVVWKNSLGLSDEELYKDYMLYSLHGQSKDALTKSKSDSWEYDILFPGYKNNMPDILASIGLVQLKRYKDLIKRRFELIKIYNLHLDKTKIKILKHEGKNFRSSGHLFLCNLKSYTENKRNEVIRRLSNIGIPSNVHYKPLPLFTAYKNLGFDIKNYISSYQKYKNVISLPLHSKLTNRQVRFICFSINKILQEMDKEL